RSSARREQLVLPPEQCPSEAGGPRAWVGGEPDSELADDVSDAGEPRLLRLLPHLRDKAERDVPRLPAGRADDDGGEREAAREVREARPPGDPRPARRHRRPLGGKPDARLVREVPRRGEVRP